MYLVASESHFEDSNFESENNLEPITERSTSVEMNLMRETVANQIWDDYQRYLAMRDQIPSNTLG